MAASPEHVGQGLSGLMDMYPVFRPQVVLPSGDVGRWQWMVTSIRASISTTVAMKVYVAILRSKKVILGCKGSIIIHTNHTYIAEKLFIV